MKKMLMVVMALVMSVSIFAAKIATVDTQRVFMGYSKTKAVQAKLEKEKTKLEGQLKIKADKLQKEGERLSAKGDKITIAEQDKFQKQQNDFARNRQELQNKLGRMEQTEMSKIQTEVKSAITQVARKGKYDLVVEGGAVLYGGKDITKEVATALEHSKKIKL